ncbi:MAG: hypothetical protein KJ583_03840 [Nanoarchaeota archaeon]|nr:hypothetical protein [Nanoarchaeota archaeon]MBU1604424.1 hypothetical protein [Nanoarchaeota archaeon]
MEITSLEKIGLTSGEIRVYIALMHLGTTTTGPIAKEAKVAGSKLYDILDRLSKKGIVSHVIKNNVRYFSAMQPSRLLDFLDKKEEEIKNQKIEIEKIIPILQQEYELKNLQQDAEVFEGLEGLKNIREKYIESMKKGDKIYFIGVPSSAYDKLEAYYKEWNEKRIKKGIDSYTLFTDEAKKHPYVKEKSKHKNTFIRFLPKNILLYSWIEIYNDTVVIAINYKKQMSIVINNKYVAETYKQYFNMLWTIAKK